MGESWVLECYERNKREIFDYIEYCKNLEEYKIFAALEYPEIKNK
jgi:hypothetical protein